MISFERKSKSNYPRKVSGMNLNSEPLFKEDLTEFKVYDFFNVFKPIILYIFKKI